MLSSVLTDLALCPGVQPIALVEPDLIDVLPLRWRNARPPPRIRRTLQFRRLAREADFTLVIAPEFDDLLEHRCRWALDEGSRLLGPTPDAVRLTADKFALAAHLFRHGRPHPAHRPRLARASSRVSPIPSSANLASARLAVHRPPSRRVRMRRLSQQPSWTPPARIDQLIVQPFVPGCR